MDSEGWASWAWSYVPDILYYEEDEEGGTRKRETRPDPILSVGLYCDRARITFKVCKHVIMYINFGFTHIHRCVLALYTQYTYPNIF